MILKNKLQVGFTTLYLFFVFSSHAGVFDNLQPIRLATGMVFTDGPSWHPDGYLVFSDINGNVIYKWTESDGVDTLLYPVGNSNGIATTRTDDFVICRHGLHDIAKMDRNGKVESILNNYNGKRLNSPNDVCLSYKGSIYFTDPAYGVQSSDRELSFEGLFCIPYNSTNLVLLDSTLIKPNGLTFVNDWRTLYVCESSTNTIYTYALRDEFTIQDFARDKKVFLKVSGNGEIDGITSDIFGNIYVAFGDGGIMIYDENAIPVGSIQLPAGEKVRNLCFGGTYNNILFITAGSSLYKCEIRFFGDFINSGLLGVPTDKSIIFNILSDKTMEAYIAYGTNSTSLNLQTQLLEYLANEPIEIKIDGLSSNTKYYYQLNYRLKNETGFQSSTSGSFYTQRASGETFSFAVEADPHLDESSNFRTFRNTLSNALSLQPDFIIDLGDNFMVEKFPIVNKYYLEQRSLLYRNFWDEVCSSMPLFIVQGNHDTELRWLSDNTEDDPFNMATTIRKKYYPTPSPDGFYSGSEVVESFVGQRENYYAWTWGDALFVVIDPYGYTENRTNDPWCFTLGKTQYDWFKSTLENSNAKFKFVFSHQIVGGDNLGRGGAEKVDYFEMGGKNLDGSYGFDLYRPGWGKPLHQIMVETGVQIFFHGHDHFYAEQEKDGIIYQEVPQPSFPSYTNINDVSSYGYVEGVFLPSSGHLNVQIHGDSARVDYIGGYHINSGNLINGQVRRRYFVHTNTANSIIDSRSHLSIEAFTSKDYLYIQSPINIKATIALYSITGKHFGFLFDGTIPEGNSSYRIPDGLAPGLYLINIYGNNFSKTVKVVRF